jgi:DNA-binding response OmpR family regulator
MLPDGSGLVFCRELRAGHPALPLVVLTGYAPHPDEPVAADLVLTKPFSAADVRFAVARLRARRPKTQGGSSRPGAVG